MNQGKAGMAILIYQVDFRAKKIARDRVVHYVMVKGLMHENVTILNVHAPHHQVAVCVK